MRRTERDLSSSDPTGTDWTDREIDLIVADYFDMLSSELVRHSYVKLYHNAKLQSLTGRSHRSIEFKHQNISAVLQRLGMPWILGYKPKQHYQNALIDGIERYLASKGPSLAIGESQTDGVVEAEVLYAGPAPTIERVPPKEFPALERLVRKFDPAVRDDRNRALGKKGEERVLASEIARLRLAGRDDLAKKVSWVSQEVGDGAGYDILSYTNVGEERFLEVKTTTGYARTPFFLSANERAFSVERPEEFRIFRLYDFAREPKAFEIAPPLESALVLEAANYRASFR